MASNSDVASDDRRPHPVTGHLVVCWAFFVVGGIWVILASVWSLTPWGAHPDAGPLGVRARGAIVIAAWGALHVVVGLKIRTRRSWARWVGIGLGVLAAVVNIQSLWAGTTLRALAGAIFGALSVYVIVVLIRSREQFHAGRTLDHEPAS